jgi:hypothetical protein
MPGCATSSSFSFIRSSPGPTRTTGRPTFGRCRIGARQTSVARPLIAAESARPTCEPQTVSSPRSCGNLRNLQIARDVGNRADQEGNAAVDLDVLPVFRLIEFEIASVLRHVAGYSTIHEDAVLPRRDGQVAIERSVVSAIAETTRGGRGRGEPDRQSAADWIKGVIGRSQSTLPRGYRQACLCRHRCQSGCAAHHNLRIARCKAGNGRRQSLSGAALVSMINLTKKKVRLVPSGIFKRSGIASYSLGPCDTRPQ